MNVQNIFTIKTKILILMLPLLWTFIAKIKDDLENEVSVMHACRHDIHMSVLMTTSVLDLLLNPEK